MSGHPNPEPWPSAETSTGARLREALDANTALAMEHAKCVIEITRLRAENQQLRERLARRETSYQITEKGRSAIAASPDDRSTTP